MSATWIVQTTVQLCSDGLRSLCTESCSLHFFWSAFYMYADPIHPKLVSAVCYQLPDLGLAINMAQSSAMS